MALQSVGYAPTLSTNYPISKKDNSAGSLFEGNRNGNRSLSAGQSHVNATLESEYYSSQKYALEFTSKDGDKVSFSMESIQYQKSTMAIDATGSQEDMQKIVDYVKDQYGKMKEELIKAFLKSQGQDVPENDSSSAASNATGELNIPEYWNAENTSNRIVDFATQFLDAFKGEGSDFLTMIKDAIEKGFKDARDMLGDLSDPVKKLVQDTHDLVMKKLDAWAKDKGIITEEPQTEVAAA